MKPKDDELLSSWLVRLASAHSLKLHSFCALVWSRDKQIWNRDIDKCADPSVVTLLAEKTATPRDLAANTTLASYEGYLYERHNPYGNTQWIMSVGVYHRIRTGYGLQFCPRCLSDGADTEVYYRRAWRLAFVTFCEQHRVSLLDRCPRCSAAINFHRNELGDRRKWMPESVTLCHACRYDLRETPVDLVERPSDCRILEFQQSLTKIMQRGWAQVPEHGTVYSHLYFTVLRQLMKICATGKRAARLREALRRELRIETPVSTSTNRYPEIERLDILERRKLLAMARHLLDEWPRTFIQICQANKVWSAALLRDLDPSPFWYWSVVHDYLYRVSYTPSDREIRSAIDHLNRTGVQLSKKSVSRCLGTNNDVFRKRRTGDLLYPQNICSSRNSRIEPSDSATEIGFRKRKSESAFADAVNGVPGSKP